VGGVEAPVGFDTYHHIASGLDVVENWTRYVTKKAPDRTRWYLRAAAGGEPLEAWLDVDDPPFRRRAGLPPSGPFALPTDEDTTAGAAFQTLVAEALRCDLYITDYPGAIDLDGETGYKYPIEAVSPCAAVPLIGLYLRRLGQYRLEHEHQLGRLRRSHAWRGDGAQSVTFFHTGVKSALWATFEWNALAGTMTPADREEFRLFSDSMLHRLEQVLRERDRLLHLLAVAPDGIDEAYAAGDVLDAVLLLSLAAIDAAAEAANLVFALGVNKPSWSDKQFIAKLATKSQGVADRFGECTGGGDYRVWSALKELRNAIHSEAISRMPVIYVVDDFAGRVLLPIPATRFVKVRDHFDDEEMGGLDRWGIFENVQGTSGAHLHPGEFVEELVPRVFALIHRIMVAALKDLGISPDALHANRYGRPLAVSEQDALALLGIKRVHY
jgi:hypothetical protein